MMAAIGKTDVAIHLIHLDAQEDDDPALSPDELLRAGRFRIPRVRRAFIAARRGLRKVLSGYLGISPAEVAFSYLPSGKPLLSSTGSPSIQFNLSHSGTLALVAVTTGREIGVDVEQMNDRLSFMELARRFFAPGEQEMLAALPEPARLQVFYRLWTSKEACLKATGAGLTVPLSSLRIAVAPTLSVVSERGGGKAPWRLYPLHVPDGYVATLATPDDVTVIYR